MFAKRFINLIGNTRAKTLLVTCGCLFGLIIAACTILLLVQLRHRDIADSERELKNLSLTIAEEVDRGLQAVDMLQVGLIEHMQQRGIETPEAFEEQMNTFEVHKDLSHRVACLSYIAAFSL